ncbi:MULTISPECIES: hypothetical protein [unclassified Gilliamella]|uniref:hypothetical protein n=1 Tax=unclassified Gilliamella TaxID=2685620 RepID=UPI00132409F8|nr:MULTISPECIES: hypothetical protein [unclassified Gilliamella]MWN31705.1 hypothetical protein [Gilliamella sp. Pra-s60]MWP28812.1 hypothetical protein [Gilliamella sp. Pra-s54]
MQKKIPFSLVFRQTLNFVRNRIKSITFVSLLVTLISTAITYDLYQPEVYKQLDLSEIINSYVLLIIMTLALSIVLKSISIATIHNLYVSDKLNPKLLLSKALGVILKIIAFYLIMTLSLTFIILFLLLIFISLSFIFPQSLIIVLIILALIFPSILLFIFTNFFLGSLAESKQKSFFESFSLSFQLTKTQWVPSFFIMLIHIVFFIIIAKLSLISDEKNIVFEAILSFCSFFFDIFLTGFFYRLYSLATNPANSNLPTKDDQQETNSLIV